MLEDERLCELCELNEVENESYFLSYCPLYDELRTPIFTEMSVKNPETFWGCDDIQMDWLLPRYLVFICYYLCFSSFVSVSCKPIWAGHFWCITH